MSQDFTPAPQGETPSARALRIGQAKAVFDAIRVDYPPQTSAMAALDEVRIAALGPRSGGCGGAMLVAPHGCGKTEAVQSLQRRLQATAPEGCIPLLYVEIDTDGTTNSLPTSILRALGAARPEIGSEKVRWPRAVAEIQRCGVELIVFDEFNRAARRATMSRPIVTAIRERIMDAGLAPVAFVGSEDAGSVLSLAPELMERLDDDIDLSPLRWDSASDRELFISFVTDLDDAMVDRGIVACAAGLADAKLARPLWEASGGRVRRICKIVRHALGGALHDGRGAICRSDLIDAVDDYCLRRGFCARNPFVRS